MADLPQDLKEFLTSNWERFQEARRVLWPEDDFELTEEHLRQLPDEDGSDLVLSELDAILQRAVNPEAERRAIQELEIATAWEDDPDLEEAIAAGGLSQTLKDHLFLSRAENSSPNAETVSAQISLDEHTPHEQIVPASEVQQGGGRGAPQPFTSKDPEDLMTSSQPATSRAYVSPTPRISSDQQMPSPQPSTSRAYVSPTPRISLEQRAPSPQPTTSGAGLPHPPAAGPPPPTGPPPAADPGLPNGDIPLFNVIREENVTYENIPAGQLNLHLNLANPPQQIDLQPRWIQTVFDEVLNYALARQDVRPADRVQIELVSNSMPQTPIFISVRRGDQLTGEVIAARIEKILNSNEEFLLGGLLRVVLSVFRQPVGNGRLGRNVNLTLTHEEFCSGKRSIINIPNTDTLCLARALVVAIALAHKDEGPQALRRYNEIRRADRYPLQTEEAENLCVEAGVILDFGGGIDEINIFQNYLDGYTITVFNDRRGRNVLFEGPASTETHPRKYLDLFFEDEHFVTVTTLTGLFDCDRYCRGCKVGYARLEEHRCPNRCPSCMNEGVCDQTVPTIICQVCQRFFFGAACRDAHLRPYSRGKSVCESFQRCPTCHKVYRNLRRDTEHRCNEMYCGVCSKFCEKGHLCHVQKVKNLAKKTSKKGFLYVFYDLECAQSTPTGEKEGEFLHEANLCVARQYCNACINEVDGAGCESCEACEHVFEGLGCVTQFVDFLLACSRNFKDITCIAHYGSGYDFHFLLKELVVNRGETPEIINNGAKIMFIKYINLRFVDSLNFLGAPLSQLPAMMCLEGDMNKGYFPHLFNRPENWDYVGPLPPKEEYTPDDMKPKARAKFESWYASEVERGAIFNFQQELVFYCKLDVEILAKACLKFRKLFLQETTVDPFKDCITIASACMQTFLKLFYKPQSIAIVPKNGYRLVDNQSRVALLWLEWVAHSRNVIVRHAGNGREVVPEGLAFKVDGYVADQKLILEFHGCWTHGCPRCYKQGRDESLVNAPDETMNTRFQRTLLKDTKIRALRNANGDHVYKLEVLWECEFKALRHSRQDLRHFCETATAWYLNPPLNPKDAFFGGRTNAIKLFHDVDVEAGEKIAYTDVCSLYPYICKYGEFPLGHPKKVVYGAGCENYNINECKGLIKCIALPPDALYHPVLPYRCNGKLMFPLCRTCAEQCLQEDCEHTDEQRALTGTWVSFELQKAVELGYKILKVFEAWEYNTTKFNGREGGLFVEYINKFLKLKQEASGWPSWCLTEEDKEKYLREYKEKEDISLDPARISHNPGFRAISKLLLNSFWGKWGQRDNFVESKIYSDPEEMTKTFGDPSLDVQSFHILSDGVVLINTKVTEEGICPGKKSNVVLAAFVTAQARLKLYSYLELLQQRLLYLDTDSTFFTYRPGQVMVELGDFLGEMTDELLKDYGENSYIKTFVSSGPKAYSFKVCVKGDDTDVRIVSKVRGITLTCRASEKVNFETMKTSVTQNGPVITVENPHKITRKPVWRLVTRSEKKDYRVVYTKRRRVPDSFDTLPFGTKRLHVA